MITRMARPRVLIPHQLDTAVKPVRGEVRKLQGYCMGTSWSVQLVAPAGFVQEPVTQQISDLLEDIENQMSHFRPESDLCRFGRLPAGASQALPNEFSRVLRAALEVAHLSQGAFDPTIAALADAWGFGSARRFFDAGFVPPNQINVAAGRWPELMLDSDNRLYQPGGVALNFAAIAKGFAVDAVAQWLCGQGFPNHLVEIGGELRGGGVKPDGQPWWVALESPATDCPLPSTRIALHGLAVATSGDYRRSYRMNGRLIHHTLDPRTGAPSANRVSSVSVIHAECMLADAWATALTVLGPEQGLALAERLNLSVLLQGHDHAGNWVEWSSAAWRDLQ